MSISWNRSSRREKNSFMAQQRSQNNARTIEKLNDADAAQAAAEKLKNVLGKTIGGYTITMDENIIIIAGAFDNDVHAKIKRAGGYWDGKDFSNRRVWVLPAAKYRVALNLVKSFQTQEQEAAAAKEANRLENERNPWKTLRGDMRGIAATLKSEFGARRDARWADRFEVWEVRADVYDEAQKMVSEHTEKNRQAEERAEEAKRTESRKRAEATSRRFLVEAGEYKVGQIVYGKRITGFGKSWRFNGEHSVYGFHPSFEGDVCYAYYDVATNDEVAAENAKQEKIAAENAEKQRIESDRRETLKKLTSNIQGEAADGVFNLQANIPADAVEILNTGMTNSHQASRGVRILATETHVYRQFKRDTVETWDYAPEYHVFTVCVERNEAINQLIEHYQTIGATA